MSDQIQGLPAGAVVEDMPQVAPQTAAPAASPTPDSQIQGLPQGAVVEDLHTPTPPAQPKPQATIGAYNPGWGERVREHFANGALGHALQQTMPQVANELGLTPTETVNSPTYQSDQGRLISAPTEAEARQHPVASGIGDFVSGMSTPGNMLLTGATMGESSAAKALGSLPNASSILPKLVTAGFSAAQVMSGVKEIPALRQAWADDDSSAVLRILTHMTLNTAAAALGGQHVIGDAKPLFPGMNEAVTDFIGKASEGTRNAIRSAVDTTADAKNNAGEQAQAAIDATKEKIFGTPEERAAKAAEITSQKLAQDTEAVHADLKQAIPPSKSAMYEDKDLANARPFLEEQNAIKPIKSVEDVRDAADAGVANIEGKVREYIKANPTDHIDNDILAKVQEQLKGNEREGFDSKGLKSLANLNLDQPLTVERADSIREQLNSENTAEMKKNSYNRHDARTKSPAFAAREAAADALREATYNKFEERGIPGVGELRQQEGSLLKLRDAAEANVLKGEDTMEGSSGPVKAAIRHGLGRAGATTAGAVMGSAGGPVGAAIGAAIGHGLGSAVENINALQDLSRDEMVGRAFEKNVTQGPQYPEIPARPRVVGVLPERTGGISVGGVETPAGEPAINIAPTTRAARRGLILPEQAGPESYPVVPPLGSSRGPIDWTDKEGNNVQQVRGFEDISGHNVTGPNTARPPIEVGPANDWQMGQRRAGTAVVKREPGTPPISDITKPNPNKWHAGTRALTGAEKEAKPTRNQTVAAGGTGAASSEELSRGETFVKYSRSGTPLHLSKSPDATLKPGEAILAVNNKTGKVRVQNTEGLSDSEALHKFGRDALKNFGPEAK